MTFFGDVGNCEGLRVMNQLRYESKLVTMRSQELATARAELSANFAKIEFSDTTLKCSRMKVASLYTLIVKYADQNCACVTGAEAMKDAQDNTVSREPKDREGGMLCADY